jgi:hypothetical protein
VLSWPQWVRFLEEGPGCVHAIPALGNSGVVGGPFLTPDGIGCDIQMPPSGKANLLHDGVADTLVSAGETQPCNSASSKAAASARIQGVAERHRACRFLFEVVSVPSQTDTNV